MTRRKRTLKMKRARMMLRCGLLVSGCLSLLTVGALLISGCVSAKPVATEVGPDGTQTAKVVVRHGYNPGVIEAQAGKPLKLEFYRDEEPEVDSCDKDLVIPSENVSIPLPVHESQIVEIKPHAAGEIEFQCGMKMMKGKIIFK